MTKKTSRAAALTAAASAFAALPLAAEPAAWRALGDHVYVGAIRGAVAEPDPEQQIKSAFDRLEAVLRSAGLELARVSEMRVALADIRHYPLVDKVIRERFPSRPPATSAYEVELAEAGVVVELVAVAARAEVAVEVVAPAAWPKPQGFFSRAVRAGDTLFLAGQVGYDPATGKTPPAAAGQAAQALANVKVLVEAAGLTLDNVVVCRAFLADPRDFAALNDAWRAAFPQDPPVRETVRAKLGGEEFKVEVACTAVAGKKRVVLAAGQTAGASPFSPALAIGNRLYTSGKIARGADWPVGPEAQTRAILAKLKADLDAAGLEPRHVVDATVFVSDIRYREALQKPWQEFFGDHTPTFTLTGAPLMAPEAQVEISFIAELATKPQ